MENIYVILGYLLALVIFYKVVTLVGGAVKMVLCIVFGAISIYVLYVVFGGLYLAIK